MWFLIYLIFTHKKRSELFCTPNIMKHFVDNAFINRSHFEIVLDLWDIAFEKMIHNASFSFIDVKAVLYHMFYSYIALILVEQIFSSITHYFTKYYYYTSILIKTFVYINIFHMLFCNYVDSFYEECFMNCEL